MIKSILNHKKNENIYSEFKLKWKHLFIYLFIYIFVEPIRYGIYFLKRLFSIHNKKFSKEWDRKLNEILDDFEFIEFDKSIIKLKHKENTYGIWIANHPYGSYTLWLKNKDYIDDDNQFRPSICTQYRFDKLVLKPVLKELKNRKKQNIKNIYE